MLPARFDSLFARLLLSQAVLVLCCVMIFGTFVIVERNTLQLPQYGEAWAAAFTAAAARTPGSEPLPALGLPGGIQRHAGPPNGLQIDVSGWPGGKVLRETLAARGVVVDQVRLTFTGHQVRLWSQVQTPGLPGAWISGYVPMMLPHWTMRTTITLGLVFAAVAGVSWNFARRVTRPLHRLQQRMQAQADPHVAPTPLPPLLALDKRSPPELLAMDAAFTLLAQRLQRNERERALLLAGVSHDLRSPLARIRLAAEMLPESAANLSGVDSITRNVDHADRLIASFMEFVRASAPDLGPEVPVDLAAITRAVVARFDRPPRDLQVHAPAPLTLHNAPGLLVDRLVANLVDNALKHGRPPVVVTLTDEGETALLTVADAGPGLPHEGAARMVEAFARGDASRALPGVGLGLAIAQQIVVRLAGTLAFERDDATGHRVQVRLPLRR
jgi:two-component system osmolarity sensor histidine kinase EnvZ